MKLLAGNQIQAQIIGRAVFGTALSLIIAFTSLGPVAILDLTFYGLSYTAVLTIVFSGLFLSAIVLYECSGKQDVEAESDRRVSRIPSRSRRFLVAAVIVLFAYWTASTIWFAILSGVFPGPNSLQPIAALLLVVSATLFFAKYSPGGFTGGGVIALSLAIGSALILLDASFDWDVFVSRHTTMYLVFATVISVALLRGPLLQLGATAIASSAVLATSSRTAFAVIVILMLIAAVMQKDLSPFIRATRPVLVASIFGAFLTFSSATRDRFYGFAGDRGVVIKIPSGIGQETAADSGIGQETAADSGIGQETAADSGIGQETAADSGIGQETAADDVSEIALNTNGRVKVWSRLIQEIDSGSLFFGSGPGFSKSLVGNEFGWEHPHNEYLRILVDFGLVGLVLLGAVIVSALLVVGRKGSFLTDSQRFLGVGTLVALVCLGLTDLPWVSFGVLMLSGFALGLALQRRKAAVPDEESVRKLSNPESC